MASGWRVVGLDSFSDYYDVGLKEARNAQLERSEQFSLVRASCLDQQVVQSIFDTERPEVVIHHGRPESDSQLITSSFLRTIWAPSKYWRQLKFTRLKYVNSVIKLGVGANSERPFSENTRSDHQLSMYATKS